MKVKNIKKSIKNTNTKRSNENETKNSFETSSIRFGKLDIVLKSYNSVPTVESFYNNVPQISNEPIKNNVIGEEKSQTMFDSVFDQNVSSSTIIPVSINPRLLLFNENSNTSLLVTCWWCRLSVIPITLSCFLPINYDKLRNKYTKHGYFCSWECIKAYAIDRNQVNTCDFITHMRLKLEGPPVKTTNVAPRKEVLQMFGGTINIDDFRKEPQRITFVMPGDIHQLPDIKITASKFEAAPHVGTMKLKREKPLERSKGTLESSLGITRKKIP